MTRLAELRSDAVYSLAKNIVEPLTPKTPFPINRTNPSIERGKQFDAQNKQVLAGGEFISVYLTSQDPHDLAESLFLLSQIDLNLGSPARARRTVDILQYMPELDLLSRQDQLYYWSRIREKKGWIAENEGGFRESIRLFSDAQGILQEIPRQQWREEKEEEVDSTATHFRGRGHFGLAAQGANREENIVLAEDLFNKDLQRFQGLRDAGNPKPGNEGYQYAWLARCKILQGDQQAAAEFVATSKPLFEQFSNEVGDSSLNAHYYLIKGEYETHFGTKEQARRDFMEAKRIRIHESPYPKGLSDANLGIALSFWKERNVRGSLGSLKEALAADRINTLKAIVLGVSL